LTTLEHAYKVKKTVHEFLLVASLINATMLYCYAFSGYAVPEALCFCRAMLCISEAYAVAQCPSDT